MTEASGDSSLEVSHTVAGKSRDVQVVRPAGTIDGKTAGVFRSTVDAILQKSGTPKVVVDFADVDYMASAGFGALLQLHAQARGRRGAIRIAGLRTEPKRIFDLLALGDHFETFPDWRAAADAAWPPAGRDVT